MPGDQQVERPRIDLAALRREYGAAGLVEGDVDPDPLVQFRRWLHDAVVARLHEPNAMIVATVSPDGQPSGDTSARFGMISEVRLRNTPGTAAAGRRAAPTRPSRQVRRTTREMWRALRSGSRQASSC